MPNQTNPQTHTNGKNISKHETSPGVIETWSQAKKGKGVSQMYFSHYHWYSM